MTRKHLDPFESPKHRLTRAKEHIRRLEKRIKTFIKKTPPSRAEELDAEGWTVHSLKFPRPVPQSWADSAGGAIEHLRSALDQCGYAAAVRGGKVDPKNAYFPFADTSTELANVINGRCKDLPTEISALFGSFEPHQGGNYPPVGFEQVV
jgi:hypothetical protein